MHKEQKGKKHPTKIECKPLILKAVTMIDPATGWFEIAKNDDKCAVTVADIVERTWLNRCPWPDKLTSTEEKNSLKLTSRTWLNHPVGSRQNLQLPETHKQMQL